MIEWSGCWEDRKDRKICRWMVSWIRIRDVIAGCIGGYSGGGCFQLEKFVESNSYFYIQANNDLTDLFCNEVIEGLEDCQDRILSFHEEHAWINAENLLLLEEVTPNLVREGDVLSGGSDIPPRFKVLFEEVGLISTFNP